MRKWYYFGEPGYQYFIKTAFKVAVSFIHFLGLLIDQVTGKIDRIMSHFDFIFVVNI